jgi:hypothetical protein
MANFTHQDTGHNSSASSTSLAITLAGAVSVGDLLLLYVQTVGAGPANTSVSDTSGNTWTNPDGSGQYWYCANAAVAAGGVTITATITGGYYVHQMIADRFTPLGTVTYGSVVATGSSGTIGLNYNNTGCGDLGTVPAGALAWGTFSVDSNDGSQSYTPGYQTGTTAPADVIGTQFAGTHGTGLSLYITSCANEDATLTWYGTGTGAIGHAGSMYFTASGSSSPQTVNLTTPNLALAAPLITPHGPLVTITTTGSTFAPVIALVNASTATVTWSCSGFSDQTGITPSFNFGSAATRTVTMTVTGGGGYADVTLFNLGYNNTYDVGRYMPPSGYALSPQAVSGLVNLNLLTGLIYFLADQTALTGSLDFTGMSALQFIQCYDTGITGVTLTGCTSLKRLMVEQANLTSLDLNPVSANLYDLRSAVQQGGTLTFAILTNPMAVEYHYCVRDQTVINSIPPSQLPAIYEYWAWNTSQSGTFALNSNATYSVLAYANAYTSADLTNQFPPSRNGILDLHSCQLTSINLTGCQGLVNIDLHLNKFKRPAIDAILQTVAGWGTSGGTLNLAGNTAPSSAGTTYVNTLIGRGWTVTVDSQSSITVSQMTNSSSNFTSSVGVGHTLFIAVFAHSAGGAITTSNPVYNFAAAPGAQKILEVMSPTGGSEVSYMAIWMLPACGNGNSPNYGLTLSGGTASQWWVFEVSGLGVAPVVDKTASNSASTGSAANSGSVQIGSSPEIILGGSIAWAGEAAGPGAPWTLTGTPNDSQHGWSGYQIAATPGRSYSWSQTAANGTNPWVAGVVTLRSTQAVSGAVMANLI